MRQLSKVVDELGDVARLGHANVGSDLLDLRAAAATHLEEIVKVVVAFGVEGVGILLEVMVGQEGAHRGGRTLKDVVLDSKATAKQQRERAQHGAAASARKGQLVQRAQAAAAAKKAVRGSAEDAAIAKEVEKGVRAAGLF